MTSLNLMKIMLEPSTPFNLESTLCCGQTFRWDKYAGWWYGVVGEKVFKIRQEKEQLDFENVNANFVASYFGLGDNLQNILREINKDNHIAEAINEFRGLRILHQDPWECLISYICATYKNIAAIKNMLNRLSGKLGKEIRLDGFSFYAFPTPTRVAEATVKELVQCGLGYRAKYASETAKMVEEQNLDLELMRKTTYDQARERLLGFLGVGPKVADCVLLFSLGKLEAFPVDVWVKRVILRQYSQHFPKEFIGRISDERSLSSSDYKRLNSFGRRYFGKYAGYAQEYLYHYERNQR